MRIFISTILGGAMGAVLVTLNVSLLDWQYYAVFAISIGLIAVNAYRNK